MNKEQEKLKTIYIGYHPRTHDGSSPKEHTPSEAIAVMEAFNKEQSDGRLRAQVVEIAYSDLCAVAVMETTIGKVWQYI
ncbi:hypothetical protein JWJ90_01370 [Desulfobulbus rhabdoformis]|jgi:hypothetical protein|uniref:hypothetical protein n=1 Tax=Desulfobulbus rhabdoformis TaxID=34032 RepID=UPI001966B1CA|nr:hypothetical protein [Desulfobulbus rhabdoformis]MBM9612930.1 hypothetical protein [Desulfobulbus rhabdoformis]